MRPTGTVVSFFLSFFVSALLDENKGSLDFSNISSFPRDEKRISRSEYFLNEEKKKGFSIFESKSGKELDILSKCRFKKDLDFNLIIIRGVVEK